MMNWLKSLSVFGRTTAIVAYSLAALGVAGEKYNEPQVITLPPLFVEGQRGPPWRIANISGMEILFRCPETLAVDVVDRHRRLARMLKLLLPLDLPEPQSRVLIIDDRNYQGAVAKELTDNIRRRLGAEADATAISMPNQRFYDQDSELVYYVPEHQYRQTETLTIADSHWAYLLNRMNAVYPPWFTEGMQELQKSLVMPVPSVGRVYSSGLETHFYVKPTYPYDEVTFRPFPWGDAAETAAMQELVKQAVRTGGEAMLPDSFPLASVSSLIDLSAFSALRAGEASPENARRVAALFLRWLYDPNPLTPAIDDLNLLPPGPKPTIDDLRIFLERGRREGFTPELFRECLKWTPGEVDVILRCYLPYASLGSAKFRISPPELVAPMTDMRSQEASANDIARLRGRLNRLSIAYVREYYPELLPDYVSQTRRTLHRPYDQGERDPRLLAELGLAEVDIGDDAAALPFLLAATEGGASSPRLSFEIERIKFAQIREADPSLRKSGAAVDEVTQHLLREWADGSALPQSCALLLEIWLRKNQPLTSRELDTVRKMAEDNLSQYRVIYPAMLLQISHGRPKEAADLGNLAKFWLRDAQEREKVGQLLLSVAEGSP